GSADLAQGLVELQAHFFGFVPLAVRIRQVQEQGVVVLHDHFEQDLDHALEGQGGWKDGVDHADASSAATGVVQVGDRPVAILVDRVHQTVCQARVVAPEVTLRAAGEVAGRLHALCPLYGSALSNTILSADLPTSGKCRLEPAQDRAQRGDQDADAAQDEHGVNLVRRSHLDDGDHVHHPPHDRGDPDQDVDDAENAETLLVHAATSCC